MFYIILMISTVTCDILVGTGSNEIYHLSHTPNVDIINTFQTGLTPSWIVTDTQKEFIYAVNDKQQGIQSYQILRSETLDLKLLNTVDSTGLYPCNLQIDETGNYLGVANYGTNFASFRIQEDGSLEEKPLQYFPRRDGSGPNEERQEGSHPHQFFNHVNQHVYISDLGTDQILAYTYQDGYLELVQELNIQSGFGPRHLASHYSNPNLLYGINELSGYVNTYFVNEDGTLKLADSIVSNPNRPWTNEDTGAAIVVSKNGQAFVSIRGQNTVSTFHIDKDGKLQFKENVSSQGATPRFITLSPNEDELFVLNQNSDSIVVFDVGLEGQLSFKQLLEGVTSPQSLIFI